MTSTEDNKQLTLSDLSNKLNDLYILKGEKTVELLEEKKKEIEQQDPTKITSKENTIKELEQSLDTLPEVAKSAVVEKIEVLKNELRDSSVSVDTINNHLTAVKERLAFVRLYGF